MATFVVALPILAGKEEPLRRFAQELLDSRLPEYEDFRRRIGFGGEEVWISCPSRREMAVLRVEVEEPDDAIRRLSDSGHPFDVWLKEKLVEFHGLDLAPSGCAPEAILASPRPEASDPRRTVVG